MDKPHCTPKPAATQATPDPDPHAYSLEQMPLHFRARLLELALQGFREHCEGCVPTDEDFAPLLWLAQDLWFETSDAAERELAAFDARAARRSPAAPAK